MSALLAYMNDWEMETRVTDAIDTQHIRCSKVFHRILNVSLNGANFKYGAC